MASSCSYLAYLKQGHWFKRGKNNFPVLPKIKRTTGGKSLLTISIGHNFTGMAQILGRRGEKSHLSMGGRETAYDKNLQPSLIAYRDHLWFHVPEIKCYPTRIRFKPSISLLFQKMMSSPCTLFWTSSHSHSFLKNKGFEICCASIGCKIHDICSFNYHFSLPLRCIFSYFSITELYILQSRKAYNHYRSYGSLAHMNLAVVIHIFITSLKFNCYL